MREDTQNNKHNIKTTNKARQNPKEDIKIWISKYTQYRFILQCSMQSLLIVAVYQHYITIQIGLLWLTVLTLLKAG